MLETLYKEMYSILCSAASQAIDLLQEVDDSAVAVSVLQKALWDAEEIYISEGEKSTPAAE